jgi:hypothetical protein
MVKGVDYGLVDGFSKPALLKPGDEKLCGIFGFFKTAVGRHLRKSTYILTLPSMP